MKLTKTSDNFEGVVWFRSQDKNSLWLEPCEMTSHDCRAAIDKLAAYEDTGLEPDEIKEKVGFMSPVCIGCDGKTEDGKRTEKCTYNEDFRKCLERSVHLSELAHAEEQGRLVILPCKVGDTLYRPFFNSKSVLEYKIIRIMLRESVIQITVCHYEYSMIKYEELVYIWQIGKKYFLTREEAEAALKEERTHDE